MKMLKNRKGKIDWEERDEQIFVGLSPLLVDCVRLMFQIVGRTKNFVVFFVGSLHVVCDRCTFASFSWY